MNNEFILFSDTHFYKNTQRSIPDTKYITSWIRSQVDILKQIFSYATDNNVETIIFNGDLFEEKNRIDQAVYNLVWELFKEYSEQGFNIIMNSGNHDLLTLSRQSSLRPFSNIVDVIQSPTRFYDDDYEFLFIPYGMVEEIDLSINYNYNKHILFLHEDMQGLTYGSIRTKSNTGISSMSFKDWTHVFLGHIHRPQTLGNIVVVGSTMCQDWGESDEIKRYIYFDSQIKSIPINCPKFYQLAGLSPRIIKSIEANDKDFFRVDVSAEELSNPIFQKYNISPYVIKSTKRELRLLDSATDEDDVKRYLEIVDTNLDRVLLENIGREIISESI